MGDICTVCRHRPPKQGHVCDQDRSRIVQQLTDVPRQVHLLTLELVPGAAPIGDWVSVSRSGSPTTARLDALTLVGPGADGISREAVAGMLHPQVRRWRTVETVTVTVAGRAEDREVVTWHQEPVRDERGEPVQALADDQVGLLPPAEWLDQWVRTWRRHFGHYTHGRPKTEQAARDALRRLPTRPTSPAGGRPGDGRRNPLAELAWREQAAHIVLGLNYGYGGTLTPEERPDDPLADEWEIRFGEPLPSRAVRRDVRYLLTWLDAACDDDVGVADFAAELRALSAELTRVLGERPDQQWLGRCPATLTDRATGVTRPCGAGLWQDPWASQVMCPRCRSTWGPGRPALLLLAAAIRRAWPIDRRRRYSLAEVEDIAAQRVCSCPTCAGPVRVEWRDTTAVGDKWRTWRPERVTCPDGCPEAGRLMA